MKKLFFSYILLSMLISSHSALALDNIRPPDGTLLYSKHVLFNWSQIPYSECYQLQIAGDRGNNPFVDELRINIFDPTHLSIVEEGVEFGEDYIWRYRAINFWSDTSEWSDTYGFRIIDLPDSVADAFELDVYEPELTQPGLNLCFMKRQPFCFTSGGDVIWYRPRIEDGSEQFFYVQQLPDGNFAGIVNSALKIFDIYHETINIIYPDGERGVHHDAVLKSDGNYLVIFPSYQWIVKGGDSLYWRGDDILEVKPDGEIVWRWSSWDHFSTEDYDSIDLSRVPPLGQFDWTHANACPIDEEEGAIYFSVRNLSRIVKIAYPDGNIIWSMGRQWPSGDVDFGHEIGFRRQHATEPLGDGNLLFYDNNWEPGVPLDSSRAIIVNVDPDRDEQVRLEWEYVHQNSLTRGDADLQPNGNILIDVADRFRFIELSPEDEIVWDMKINFAEGNYRVQRLASLYPQEFTITSPPDTLFVYPGFSDITFIVNNEGGVDQVYDWKIYDTRRWFDIERAYSEIKSGSSLRITIFGELPDVEQSTLVILTVSPIIAEEKADTVFVWVFSDRSAEVSETIENDQEELKISLYPNPFNNRIQFTIFSQKPANLFLEIFDVQGRIVRQLKPPYLGRGVNRMSWDGTNMFGRQVVGGVYFYRLNLDEKIKTGTIQLLE